MDYNPYDSGKDVREEIKRMEIEFAKFTAMVNEWMSSTTEYRKNLCFKIDELVKRFNDLPCRERKNVYIELQKQLSMIWVFLSAIVVVIVVEFIKLNMK